jgi:hypothetical protein
MFRFLKWRVLHAWIACLAVLFGALAPAFGQVVFASQPGTIPTELCTSTGMKAVDSGGDSKPAGHADAFVHCAYCVMQAHMPALEPPAGTVRFFAQSEQTFSPLLFESASRPARPWTIARSRAPPAA